MLNLDTHVLLYALTDDLTARERALSRDHTWSISAIDLWEIAKRSELRRIEIDWENPELVRTLARIQTLPYVTVLLIIWLTYTKGDIFHERSQSNHTAEGP
jgi:PIN domain nuclease of toxin-antitoxin system